MLGSQSLVLATAMAVAILVAFSRIKSDPPPTKHPLRSCLSTPESKKRRPKKKVRFADNVMETKQGDEQAKVKDKPKGERSCRSEMDGMMPPNRIALYNGILKDRSQQRVEFSH